MEQNLEHEDIRKLANYKKISSFINYLKINEISYKILDMNFRKENEDCNMIIEFDLMYCCFPKTTQNIKTFNELKEKWNGVNK